MSETENKQGPHKPSLVEKLAKDPMRYILFLTSFSVILITLGIIQTLLFEAVTFFQDIADSRGWFGLEFDCLLYTSPSPRDKRQSRMPSSA